MEMVCIEFLPVRIVLVRAPVKLHACSPDVLSWELSGGQHSDEGNHCWCRNCNPGCNFCILRSTDRNFVPRQKCKILKKKNIPCYYAINVDKSCKHFD